MNIQRQNQKAVVSFFDQFPEWNGHRFQFRGTDGYANVTALSKAIGKRFRDWTKTKFAQKYLQELSNIHRIPVGYEIAEKDPAKILAGSKKPLIDYISGDKEMYVHKDVAIGFCMSDPVLMARVVVWMSNMDKFGTANPHVNDWTGIEIAMGIEFNRDDIKEMYG